MTRIVNVGKTGKRGVGRALFLRLVSISKSICCFGGKLCAPPPCALSARSHGRTKDAFFALHGAPVQLHLVRSGWKKVSPRESVARCLPPLLPSVANPQLASRARFKTRPPFFLDSFRFWIIKEFFFSFFLLLFTHFSPQLISICEW